MGDFVSILIENLILMQGATKQVSETKERNELHLGKKKIAVLHPAQNVKGEYLLQSLKL